jgi:tetratricopeptide (TPR) repeat protein
MALSPERTSGNLFGPNRDQFGFANDLMARGDYYRAIGEFKRFLYFFPSDSMAAEARLNIAKSLFLARRYDDLIEWRDGMRRSTDNALELDLLEGHSYFRLGRYDVSLPKLAEAGERFENPLNASQACYLAGLSAVRLTKYQLAASLLEQVTEDSPYHSRAESYLGILQSGHTYAVKSPLRAGLLSVIPGLGYAYSEHYQTAIAAFFVDCLLGWAAADAFRDNDTAEGITVSIFALGFYLGSITGSVQTVHRYNKYQYERYQSQFTE